MDDQPSRAWARRTTTFIQAPLLPVLPGLVATCIRTRCRGKPAALTISSAAVGTVCPVPRPILITRPVTGAVAARTTASATSRISTKSRVSGASARSRGVPGGSRWSCSAREPRKLAVGAPGPHTLVMRRTTPSVRPSAAAARTVLLPINLVCPCRVDGCSGRRSSADSCEGIAPYSWTEPSCTSRVRGRTSRSSRSTRTVCEATICSGVPRQLSPAALTTTSLSAMRRLSTRLPLPRRSALSSRAPETTGPSCRATAVTWNAPLRSRAAQICRPREPVPPITTAERPCVSQFNAHRLSTGAPTTPGGQHSRR